MFRSDSILGPRVTASGRLVNGVRGVVARGSRYGVYGFAIGVPSDLAVCGSVTPPLKS